ncbi:MAG: CRISPR-associated endonuclease Cas2 [Lachnospiraceae bacterium]|nr:CRISPR-associated endonuclease Cas2 [Lachnospiraceae bacterium]
MYVVSYDITEDKRRNKIAKLLEGYGRRVQYSVFECRINEKKMKVLYAALADLTRDMQEGSVYIYPICASCEKKRMIIGEENRETAELQQPVIVI